MNRPTVHTTDAGELVRSVRTHPLLRRVWFHALFLAAVLFALLPLLNNGSIAAVDEAVYATQAANLSHGSWSAPRPLPYLDRNGRDNILMDSVIKGEGSIPYGRQPLYPLLLAPLYRLGGYSALLLLSLIGTWIAATSAAAIARRIDARAAIPTLWITGLGTPLLFDAYIVMGHSVVAAAAGLSCLALLRGWGSADAGSGGDSSIAMLAAPVSESTPKSAFAWVAVALVTAAAAVLLRSEGALVVGSLAAVGTLLSVERNSGRVRVDPFRVASSVAVGVVGVVAYVFNGRWVGVITGTAVNSGSIDRGRDPLNQAWASFLRPWGLSESKRSPVLLFAVVLTVVAVLLWRLRPDRPFVPAALLLVATCATVARALGEPTLVTGLVATVPVLLVGVLLVGGAQLARRDVRLLLGSSAMTVLGILWFAYGEGGASEWGGRFFHVVIPLLVPVAVASIIGFLGGMSRPYRIAFLIGMVAMTTATSVLALRVLVDLRSRSHDIVEGTISPQLSRDGIVITAPLTPNALSRYFWQAALDGVPVINGGDMLKYVWVMKRTADAGSSELRVVTDLERSEVQTDVDLTRSLDGTRWRITASHRLGGTEYTVFTIRPAA